MKPKVTITFAFSFVRHAVIPICWPPPIGASTLVVLKHNLWFWFGAIVILSSVLTSFNNIRLWRHDTIRVIKISSEVSAMLSALSKMIICKMVGPRLQVVITEMETFMMQANPEEKELMQRYVDKFFVVHAFTIFSATVAIMPFICAPMMTPQLLPGDTAYPFEIVEGSGLWIFLYIVQSYTILIIGTKVILDVFFATLLWYIGARFEMLSVELGRATTAEDVHRCAQKHQEVMRCAEELRSIVRIIAVEVTVAAMITIVCGGFILTRNPTQWEVGKYVFYEIGASMELFMYTWTAGNLMDTSGSIANAAYNCNWIGKSPKMLKSILIIIQHAQNPVVIAFDGILPVLSLEFYGSTMAATFSYLTTLRAMAES